VRGDLQLDAFGASKLAGSETGIKAISTLPPAIASRFIIALT
jgi:hypothetical protein